MDKRRYFTRKVLNALLTIILVACFNFMLFRILPGNPARLLLPKGHYSAIALAQQKKVFHLDKPLWEQFGYYWVDTLKGNFGDSYAQHQPVIQVVGRAIVPTLVLVGTGTLFATIIGIVVGVFAGWRRNQHVRRHGHQPRHGALLDAHVLGSDDLHPLLLGEAGLVPQWPHDGRGCHVRQLHRQGRRLPPSPLLAGLRVCHHLRGRVRAHHAQLDHQRHERGLHRSRRAPRASRIRVSCGAMWHPMPCCPLSPS